MHKKTVLFSFLFTALFSSLMVNVKLTPAAFRTPSLFPSLLSLFIVCCSVCLLLCHLQAILKASQMQNDFCIAVVALSLSPSLSLSGSFCPSLWAFITDFSPLSPIASFEHASWIKPIVKSYFYVHISFLANIYACLSHSLPLCPSVHCYAVSNFCITSLTAGPAPLFCLSHSLPRTPSPALLSSLYHFGFCCSWQAAAAAAAALKCGRLHGQLVIDGRGASVCVCVCVTK